MQFWRFGDGNLLYIVRIAMDEKESERAFVARSTQLLDCRVGGMGFGNTIWETEVFAIICK